MLEEAMAMSEYEKIRDAIEQEVLAIRKSIITHPERLSEYGVAYWEGNVAALNWALTKLEEIQGLPTTMKEGTE